MSKMFKAHRSKILAMGSLLTASYFFLMSPLPARANFKMPSVQNIEDRYSARGGSKHSTPGAGTMRGNPDDVAPRGDPQNLNSGMGSKEWQEKIAGQKADPSTFDRAWNKTNYGTEKGK